MNRARLARRWYRDERGSSPIEACIAILALGAFVIVLIYGGRVSTANDALESAAADAARSASIARTAYTAIQVAQQTATASITSQQIACTHLHVSVNTADFTKAPGQPGTVEVTVSCVLNLSDLSLPGIPGSRTLTASMTSPLDTWRQS